MFCNFSNFSSSSALLRNDLIPFFFWVTCPLTSWLLLLADANQKGRRSSLPFQTIHTTVTHWTLMFELYVVVVFFFFFVFYCKIIKWLNHLCVTCRLSDALKDKTTLMLEKPATSAAVCKTHEVKWTRWGFCCTTCEDEHIYCSI